MVKMNMVQALNLALEQEMTRDDSVIVLGEDVGVDGGVFRVTDGLYDKFGEERVIDTPLAESTIFGGAIGMAMAGLRPVAEMQFSGFAYFMLAQLEGHASRYRSRTHGLWSVPLVVRMPYGGAVKALEHHSARALLTASIRDPDPVVFMEPKRSYRAFREEVPEEEEVLEIGKAQVVQQGSDLTVVAWGAMMRSTLQGVAEIQERRGVSIELIDLLTIAPMDDNTIVSSVEKTGRCLVVQEAPKSFGVASEIIARINDKALLSLEAPVRRVTHYDVVTPYFGRELMFIPDVERITRAMEETLDF
jgi:pyruvate dehydrogenase E1 component beta subunit